MRPRAMGWGMRRVEREMRAICLVVVSCVIAVVAAGCGTTLGSEEEGLELLPGAPLVEPTPEPAAPVEPLALDPDAAPVDEPEEVPVV